MSATPSASVRVREAQARVEAARLELSGHVAALRTTMHRQKTTLIVGSGFVAGLAMGVLPTRFWTRIGAVLGGAGALVAKSMFTPMIAGALLARTGVTPPDEPSA